MSPTLRRCALIWTWTTAASCLLACGDRGPAARAQTGQAISDERAAAAQSSHAAALANANVEVVAVVELPREPRTQALSGTWFDPSTRTLFAVKDNLPWIVPFVAREDFHNFTAGTPLVLSNRPSSEWDGEALSHAGDAFYAVTHETSGLVERFDAHGMYLGPVALPALYGERADTNKGLESLTLSPSGNVLFAANEAALQGDGPRASEQSGTLLRVLRKNLGTGQATQHAYRTQPLDPGRSGGVGVSDLLALSDHELLVLERGFDHDYGNSVRVFRVDVHSSPDVSARAELGSDTPVLAKTLLVDVSTLPSHGVTNPGKQPNPILENYEALALGPVRADKRTLMFLTSDDNAHDTQRARVLVLAVMLQ